MDSSDDEKPDPSMMEKEAEKVQENLWKAGYRDGKEEGRQAGFQDSFDSGYATAFRISMQFGLLQGMIDALLAKDAAVGAFIRPVTERLEATKKLLTSFCEDDENLEDPTGANPSERFSAILNEIKQDFIRLYPYGEEEAERLLKTTDLDMR